MKTSLRRKTELLQSMMILRCPLRSIESGSTMVILEQCRESVLGWNTESALLFLEYQVLERLLHLSVSLERRFHQLDKWAFKDSMLLVVLVSIMLAIWLVTALNSTLFLTVWPSENTWSSMRTLRVSLNSIVTPWLRNKLMKWIWGNLRIFVRSNSLEVTSASCL